MWVTPAVTAFSSVAQLVKRRANMKFAPRLFPRVPHRRPASSPRLPERLSRCAPFLLCSDVPTFSPVFNRLTVNSTVTFGRLHRLLAGFSACPVTQFTVKPWRLPLLYHSIVPCAFRENRPSTHAFPVSGHWLSPVRPKGAALPSHSLCWCVYQ